MPRDAPFSCIVCEKRFVNSQNLAQHYDEHQQSNIKIKSNTKQKNKTKTSI